MSLSTLLIVGVVLLFLLSILHIPLPLEICDRRKIYLVELGLRISNEHFVSILPDEQSEEYSEYLGESCRISSWSASEEQTNTVSGMHFSLNQGPIQGC